ncbi:unnamed protein product [Scytosiphon promiscuus]
MDPSMDDPMSEEEDDDDLDLPPGGDSGSSGSGGGDGKGVVVEGVEVTEEDVYAYGDPDDPLDRVLDVYLADELEDHLYLLQYPMRPADRPLTTPLAVKVKAKNHLLEVEHAIKQGGKHFDKNAPPQLRQVTQKHTGSRVRPATNFAFGVIRNGEFHLTPVHATMQMRPCFQHIDEAKALEIEVDLDDPDNGGAKAPEKPQQVSFKKKESERATAARKSTYAYKKSIEDAEPWVALEVHGQNDQRSLDEFSRMFVDNDDDDDRGAAAKRGTTSKEFPPCERYLQGLDYMEEYDENGESFSAGGRGRSLEDTIDLVTAGTSTYSPVKMSSAPVQYLGGDAKIIGYLKLAHLVPFTVLLDVTKMSPAAVLGALSVEGRQQGLLLRGNWAARAADIWGRGPPHAADCLSVAQCLLHKYGAVSRPDLQRRFPALDPVTLKEVLSRIGELDTIDRRWVPKLKDGITFGMDHPDIIELEEERWALLETALKARLGEDILDPPSCRTFEPFVKVVASAAMASVAAAASAARAPASRAVPAFGVLRRGPVAPKQEIPSARAAAPSIAGGGGAGSEDKKPIVATEQAGGAAASKGKIKAGAGIGSKAAGTGGAATGPPAKRHFKPKKRPAKTAAGAGGGGGGSSSSAGRETAVKQEHEGVMTGGLEGGDRGGAVGGGCGVEESKDTATAAVLGGAGGGGGSRGRRETGAAKGGAAASSATTVALDGDGSDADVVAGKGAGPDDARMEGLPTVSGSGVGGGALPSAKEEPRERSGASKSRGQTAAMEEEEDEEGENAVGARDGGHDVVPGEGAGATQEEGRKGKKQVADAKGKGGASGKAKEEPAARAKVRPRATRAKPKGK